MRRGAGRDLRAQAVALVGGTPPYENPGVDDSEPCSSVASTRSVPVRGGSTSGEIGRDDAMITLSEAGDVVGAHDARAVLHTRSSRRAMGSQFDGRWRRENALDGKRRCHGNRGISGLLRTECARRHEAQHQRNDQPATLGQRAPWESVADDLWGETPFSCALFRGRPAPPLTLRLFPPYPVLVQASLFGVSPLPCFTDVGGDGQTHVARH